MTTPTDSAGRPEPPAAGPPDPRPCDRTASQPADQRHRDPHTEPSRGGPSHGGPSHTTEGRRGSYRSRRLRRRRRRAVLLGLVLLGAGGFVGLYPDDPQGDPAPVAGRLADGTGGGRPTGGPDGGQPPTGYPRSGPGRFTAADGRSEVYGSDGPLHRYRIEVEQGTGQDVDAFAAAVDATLGDPNSWIRSGELRFQRVPEVAAADFTIYLATPATSERICAEGGLDTEGYTSCRLPGRVVINLARWMDAVPDYGAPLSVYRTYVVNHEVGHELGEEHQACPGVGEPAPVMQQQTYGLDGCVANAWPYVDGSRYSGELIPGA
ncbi:DUF3152 domain-containing protein [Micromonospora sp. RL09-050-HVF-A]|uniref:DUF3152 domain-containing protein n=1 Tax=Micromonospora sp. RL09-050-HVF-A TaxID=1703433 RepID=UPI0027E38923|nr:DUF3152 domain-containing protein [Micromonospora sp. RL09-050-HVF-A]